MLGSSNRTMKDNKVYRCSRCNRRLKSEKAKRRGIGAICEKKSKKEPIYGQVCMIYENEKERM